MAKRANSRRARFEQWLAENPVVIDEQRYQELKTALTPVSDSYLRDLLKHSGASLSPMVEGVAQSSLEDLERTLTALREEYTRGDIARRKAVRAIVIQSKDRLRWRIRRTGEDPQKQEMLLWIMTWLENPESFDVWLNLRKRRL